MSLSLHRGLQWCVYANTPLSKKERLGDRLIETPPPPPFIKLDNINFNDYLLFLLVFDILFYL